MYVIQSDAGRSIKRFMHDFYFKSALALDQTNGVGAVACAALSEDLRMLGEVVEAEAPLDCLVNRRMAFVSDTCPLHMVADRGADPDLKPLAGRDLQVLMAPQMITQHGPVRAARQCS